MTKKLIISGFGGQGVLSTGVMIAESAVHQGMEATFFPSYGAEMRGGTANCQVVFSDDKIGSPLLVEADVLVAFNEPSIDKFIDKVKNDGIIFINSSVIKKEYDFGGRKVVKIPIDEIALKQLGNTKVANMVMLGAFLKEFDILKMDEVKNAVNEKFGRKGKKIVDLNYKALDTGFSY